MRIARHSLLILCCTAIGSCSTLRPSERTPGIPPPETIDDTFHRVSQHPLNTVMNLSDAIRIVVETDDAIYLFTKPGHPAHKSYLYTRNIRKKDGWHRVTTGYSENNGDAYEKWLSDHRINDGLLQSR